MSIKAIANKIGMDYENVLEDFCGDVSLISAKIDTLIDDCAFDSLEKAFAEKNAQEIKKCAHRIKKTAEKIGIIPLKEAAENLEDAKEGRFESAYEVLAKEFANVKSAIENSKKPE